MAWRGDSAGHRAAALKRGKGVGKKMKANPYYSRVGKKMGFGSNVKNITMRDRGAGLRAQTLANVTYTSGKTATYTRVGKGKYKKVR